MNNKILELFNFCGENHIDFTYETGESGTNQITHYINGKEKRITIKICNPDDENLGNLIDEKIKEFRSKVL